MTKRKEKVQQKIVTLIFIIYWLLIFEGALRKWIFPQFDKLIFFMRDPFVFYVYVLAWKNGIWPKKIPVFSYGFLLSAIGVGLIFLQWAILGAPIISSLYGWRNYFFYIPLAFIIGEQFDANSLKKLIRQTMLISIPMAALVYKQTHSPVTSFINKSVVEGVFYTETGSAGGDIIRAMGTFTFFHGYQLFLGSLIAFCFICWLSPKKDRPVSTVLLYLGTVATIISFALDITRLPTFLAILIFMGCFMSSSLINSSVMRKKILIMTSLLIVFGFILTIRYFGTLHEVRSGRFESTYLKNRVKGMFTSVDGAFIRTPFFGSGLGATSRGGAALGAVSGNGTGENEWQNHVAGAGPIFGFLYIFFRIWLTAWLFKGAVVATSRSQNPSPLILFSFIAPIILIWYITSKGSVNGYGWLFAGFCMVANRLGKENVKNDINDIGNQI